MLVGISYTLNYYLFANQYVTIFKKQPTLVEMVVWEIPYWILWAALSPLVFRITRRFRIEREHWFRNSLVQIFACLLFSIGHRGIYLIVGWWLDVVAYRPLASVTRVYEFLFFFNLPTGFMSYGIILLVGYVIDYYRRTQEEELQISHLKTELAQAQLQTARAELQALKMQLQPHFLFNTLHSVSALLHKDNEAADKMIARLGDFLRLTLENSGAQEVTLQQEIEFLKCYLEIEHARFQDRLTVQMNIEPQTLEARVPNLILQPIVENAIRHGIAPRATPGRIEVLARRENGLLHVQVTDDGPGLQRDGNSANSFKEGLGLANTRSRLQHLYGASHRFELTNATDGGLVVTLEIPFQVEATTMHRNGSAFNDL
jgi:sensor histidine kinase YesM